MTEPSIGDRVRFKDGGASRVGVVTAVITAGRAKGRGVWALRRRVRIRFEEDGHGWETHRDLTSIAITAVDEQLTLFDHEAPA
jgi:hypothetical protein